MLSEVGKASQALSWLGKSNRLRLKFVTKVNGKDVLWSLYTLRFTISENFIRIAKALDVELFVEDARWQRTLATYFTVCCRLNHT